MVGFKLPLPDTEAREAMGDIETLAVMLDPANVAKLPTLRQALNQGRNFMARSPEVKAVHYVILRADDERHLIRVGRRGGWRKVWNFGTGK